MLHKTRRALILLSVIQALYFGIFAVTSYQTVYLQNEAMTGTQIGMIVAVSSVTGLVASPLWGILSDRLRSARGTFLLCVAVTALMYALLPHLGAVAGGGFGFYGVYIPAIFIFKQASNAMLDGWCIGELAPLGVSYGSVRMWGSIGYCVSFLLLGTLVGTRLPVHQVFGVMAPLLAVLLLTGSWIPRQQPPEKKKSAPVGGAGQLMKNRQFLIYLLYALGLNIYLAVTLIFMPYILEAAGCEAAQVGTVTGFRALMEITSMFLGAKLCKCFPTRYIMVLPGLLFGLEHLCYGFAAGLPGLLCVMVLSGLAGGFFYSLGPSYIFEIVSPEVVHTAQTLNAMDLTLVSIVGSALGGAVIDRWGVHAMTTFCGCLILVLTALFGGSLYLENKKRCDL